MGGSNGGLLVGVALTQRPELFNAVVVQVPLLDMQRYNKLLAGASWMAEYGDPDKPDEWAFISKYSPYQNLKPDTKYPKVLFTTTTRDDRVHPGHARKMVAKMESMGYPVLLLREHRRRPRRRRDQRAARPDDCRDVRVPLAAAGEVSGLRSKRLPFGRVTSAHTRARPSTGTSVLAHRGDQLHRRPGFVSRLDATRVEQQVRIAVHQHVVRQHALTGAGGRGDRVAAPRRMPAADPEQRVPHAAV